MLAHSMSAAPHRLLMVMSSLVDCLLPVSLSACLARCCACRQHLEHERRGWEQRLQQDVVVQQASMQEQHQHRLWLLQQQLEAQARDVLQGIRQELEVVAVVVCLDVVMWQV